MIGSFCQKHIIFQLENFRGTMCLKSDAKFKGKLTHGLNNVIRNLVIFMQEMEIGYFCFDGFLLSKRYENLDEKVQKSYVS